MKGMKAKNKFANTIIYVILIVMGVLWLVPFFWIFVQSFRAESAGLSSNFFPKEYSLQNYVNLFTNKTYDFKRWFGNTLIVSVCCCLLTTAITLCTAYCMSRFKFKARQPFMKGALVLGMFPGFMSMIAVYYILDALKLTQSLVALILVYSASAGLGFYIAKGFFDTIPRALDEAARIDGASNATTFWKIVLPMAKPIIVYTALMAFMAPWTDFIFAKIIMGAKSENWTVSIGLFELVSERKIGTNFTLFAAGSVVVATIITTVFVILQRYYVEGITGGAVKG